MRYKVEAQLTFCFLLPPFGSDLADAVEARSCGPGPGDIARGGTLGGGPGSAAGDLRWIDLWEVGGACMSTNPLGAKCGGLETIIPLYVLPLNIPSR